MFTSKRIFSALGVSVLLATIAVADPPARVARINYLQGSVSLQRGDLDEWNQAVINYPLVANDSLWTDDQARAELHIGSTAMRLSDGNWLWLEPYGWTWVDVAPWGFADLYP